MYCMNLINSLAGETSILKLDTDTLLCYEIYQSKFQIVHLSLYEKSRDLYQNIHKKRNSVAPQVVKSEDIFQDNSVPKKRDK